MLPELTIGQAVLLATLGLSVGAVGASVGVGGGFLLVPALLIIYPGVEPEVITAISLTAVVANAASATFGYRRRRWQDVRTGTILIAAAVPAAVGGAFLTRATDRESFDVIFGVALLLGASYLVWRGSRLPGTPQPTASGRERRLVDRAGVVYAYRVNERVAASIAVGAGFVAAFFGIGGGIINVPVMMLALRMPSRIAVATSQMELLVASSAAVIVHVAFSFDETELWVRALIVSAGTLTGAQVGVSMGGRIGGRSVLLIIAAGLLLAGGRQLVTGLR